MKLTQLSLFLENKPGSLTLPCKLLAKAGINILTLSIGDTEQFGILRLIVKEPDKAKKVLEKGGCVVKETEVVAIEVADQPGGLAGILEALEGENVNVEYMYAFTVKQSNKGVLVFRFDHPDHAIKALKKHRFNVLGQVELYSRLEN
ncbi:MAG: ACT domain-containing protein [Verrucomicrobiae bacterium]|nr:ACT domain-containing protein [Verrucomicrobiae bacterium]